MSWFSVLPVVATLLAEAPASVPPVDPVVDVPTGAGQPVAAPSAPAPQAPIGKDGTVTRWYGAPAVAADVIELALLGGVLAYERNYKQAHPESGAPGPLGAGYWHAPGAADATGLLVLSTVVSGAVVHGLNHHWGRAAGSIALRAGALLAGGLGAYLFVVGAVGDGNGYSNKAAELSGIVLIPLPFVAMAIDDAVLARDRVPAPAQAAWTPTLRIQSGLALLGIRGSF